MTTSTEPLDLAHRLVECAREVVTTGTETGWHKLDGPTALALTEALAATQRHLDAALLHTVHRVEELDATQAQGWASTKDYLTHLTGAHHGAGGSLLRTARLLGDLPGVATALDEGRISLPQARAIANAISTLPRHEALRGRVAEGLLERATDQGPDGTGAANASMLTAELREIVRQADPEARIINGEANKDKAERGAHLARHLSFTEDQWGGVKLTGYGTAEEAEAIKATLHPLAGPRATAPGACGGRNLDPGEPWRDADGRPNRRPCPDATCTHDGIDHRDHGIRMWDALVEACDRLRATDTLPRDHGNRPTVIVLIDQESLQQQAIDAGLAHPGHTTTGTLLAAQTTRRLACDAHLIPAALGSQSQILDVGRSQRLVTPALWNALLIRDRHCAFPGCSRLPIACDAHHIQHWADGGTTSLDNLLLLCRHHHRLVHHSPWTVHIDAGTGQPVWTPPQPPPPDAPPSGYPTYRPTSANRRPRARPRPRTLLVT